MAKTRYTYKLIEALYAGSLEDRINKLAEKGYICDGPMQIVATGGCKGSPTVTLYQRMYRESIPYVDHSVQGAMLRPEYTEAAVEQFLNGEGTETRVKGVLDGTDTYDRLMKTAKEKMTEEVDDGDYGAGRTIPNVPSGDLTNGER